MLTELRPSWNWDLDPLQTHALIQIGYKTYGLVRYQISGAIEDLVAGVDMYDMIYNELMEDMNNAYTFVMDT